MLVKHTVEDFCLELASASPAPGGGSAAAFAGATGAALEAMVCNLTIGKKKYAEVEDEMRRLRDDATALQQRFLQLIDDDAEAFNGVMRALALPKETDEQRVARARALQSATKRATETPLEVMRLSRDAMQIAGAVAARGNRNSISDAGAGACMLRAACDAAALNVRINLGGLDDTGFVNAVRDELNAISAAVEEGEARIRTIVDGQI